MESPAPQEGREGRFRGDAVPSGRRAEGGEAPRAATCWGAQLGSNCKGESDSKSGMLPAEQFCASCRTTFFNLPRSRVCVMPPGPDMMLRFGSPSNSSLFDSGARLINYTAEGTLAR